MNSLANGDLTESFFHLSLDHSTDHLSSEDDVSMHTMDDLEAFLKLAKSHDMRMRLLAGKSDVSADDAFFSEDSVHRIRNRKVGPVRRQLSDSVLDAGSLQSTPLFHRRKIAEKQRKSMDAARESDDSFVPESSHDIDNTFDGDYDRSPAHDSTYDLGEDSNYSNHSNTELPAGSKVQQGLDLQSLFKAFQPLIDEYIQQKLVRENTRPEYLPESDPESAVDDTFDRPRRTHLRVDQNARATPVTSPPQSSGDSQFRFDKSTEVEESGLCQQILPGDENDFKSVHKSVVNVDTKPKESEQHPTVTRRRGPRIEVGDLTNDEINLDFSRSFEEAEQARKSDESKETLQSLQLKLEQYKKDNDGMLKEIKYLRCKLDRIEDSPLQQERGTGTQQNNAISLNTQLRPEQENRPPSNIFEENLPEQFRPFYQRLQLSKVDELSGDEKSYLIKNLMLLILVSDFDHLSVMAPKVGAYLRVTTLFLDSLHEEVYPDLEMKPLQYLKNYNLDIGEDFQRCIDEMKQNLVAKKEPIV